MKIVTLTFEDPITLSVQGKSVKLVAFKTAEHGNIKFGVDAPRDIKVHREEIYQLIKLKEKYAESN